MIFVLINLQDIVFKSVKQKYQAQISESQNFVQHFLYSKLFWIEKKKYS